jgi:hypothetical protein
MKRYLVFQFDQYYPSGGWSDFTGAYDTLTQALKARADNPQAEYYHIVDSELGGIVETDKPERFTASENCPACGSEYGA